MSASAAQRGVRTASPPCTAPPPMHGLGARFGCRVEYGPKVSRRALPVEELAYRVPEFGLLFGECESHDQPRGNPSIRSATTFRWISLVPA